MLRPISKLTGHAIEATNGHFGTVSDVLCDDATWKTRWLVTDTGHWLPGRRVLIHPSAIGEVDYDRRRVFVKLTKARIKDSPGILHDQLVSRQMEAGLYGYYGWDPLATGRCGSTSRAGRSRRAHPGRRPLIAWTRSAPVSCTHFTAGRAMECDHAA